MGLFKKECGYCKKKIEKGQEIFRNVKILGFIGTREKAFCCSEHADAYEQEMREHATNTKCRSSCCG